MDEALEPQDLVEQTIHNHHAQQHNEGGQEMAPRKAAVAAAVLAVCAALGSLLAGHAANQAILEQTRASDQWAYYQAKSTKVQIYDADKQLVNSLAALEGNPTGSKVQNVVNSFSRQEDKYNQEKQKIEQGARTLEDESAAEFRKHQDFALGIAILQIGIVLSSVSIMVRRRWLYLGSIAAGVLGLAGLVVGLIS